MSENQRIAQELDAAAEPMRNGKPIAPLSKATDAGELRIELTQVNAIASAFTNLTLTDSGLKAASSEHLTTIAQDLSNRLGYLLEPMCPIESDLDARVVQMRSQPPTRNDGVIRFYELVVCDEGLNLCRYEKAAGQDRQVIPTEVTREVMIRLAEDFVAAVQ